jgi:hypothetical protein
MLRINLDRERISAYQEKWQKVLSTPIDRDKAIATLTDLYQWAGYAAPKVAFVDSPLALFLTCNTLSQQFSDPFCERLGTQVDKEVVKQIDSLKSLLDEQLGKLYINEGSQYFCSKIAFEPLFSEAFDHRWAMVEEYFTPSGEFGEVSHIINHSPLYNLIWRAGWESGLEYNIRDHYYRRTRRLNNLNAAAMYDCAAEYGVQFEPECLKLFLNTAMYLEWVILFDEICIVSDRPQVKFDSQGQLHAEGEPAFMFPDGFSRRYFNHGIELPEYMGSVHPHQWKAEWVLQERNAELRRILIQEIGYSRLCQELQAEELDSWREYTLLRLPIYDYFATSRQSKVPSTEATDTMYLLKMTCPSTSFVHILRVPPSMQQAREAATWVNWGIDPESFTHET